MAMRTSNFVCIITNNYDIGKHRYLAICITCVHSSLRTINNTGIVTRSVVRLRIANEKIIILLSIDVFRQKSQKNSVIIIVITVV